MADVTLWANMATGTLAAGPTSDAPLQAPIGFVQDGDYVVDFYFVEPTGNAGSPWLYLDPLTFSALETLLGQLNGNLYLDVASFTHSTGFYGPKATMTLNIVNPLLDLDLEGQVSVKCLLQIIVTTSTSRIPIQIAALITALLNNMTNNINNLFSELSDTFSSAGTDQPTIPQFCKLLTFEATAQAGSGAYIRNIQLLAANRIQGDKFCLTLSMPASTNPTVKVLNNAGSIIYTETPTGAAYTRLLWFTFNSTDWTSDQ